MASIISGSIGSGVEEDARPEVKRWTADQFLRFADAGELGDEDERFELIDGEIVKKLGQSDRHVFSVMLTSDALKVAFGGGFHIHEQIATGLGGFDRPEPDVVVLRRSVRQFEQRKFEASDVALVVEVVDSRLDTARGKKLAMYARNGVQEYWIVDVRRRVVEVRLGARPASEEWTQTRIYSEAESIIPTGASGTAVAVVDLLPAMEAA